MRQTKIVATLGPSTDDAAVMDNLIDAGMDVARVNFSHGGAKQHRRRVELARECAEKKGRPVGVLSDLQGPKIRIGEFENGVVELQEDDRFILDTTLEGKTGTQERVGVTYKDISGDLEPEDILLLDDGNIVLRVTQVSDREVKTRVEVGGELSSSKGINRRGGGLSAATLTAKDHADIRLAAELEIDYLAVSFVRSALDIQVARELFRAAGGKGGIMAKIERAEALDNLEEIVEASDAVMIARGDLGVEVGNAELPGVQKRICRLAREKNCITVTATQMMQSMVDSPQPTRAEVLDVANAVLDGTDAVMLSAESAVGKHPAKVVLAMDRICQGAESQGDIAHAYQRTFDAFDSTEEAIAMATMYSAQHFGISAIIALTESGSTAKWMSRQLQGLPIYAVTRHKATQRRVSLYRGVHSINYAIGQAEDVSVDREVVHELMQRGLLAPDERVAITKGDLTGVAGGTNTLKILRAGA